MFLFTAALTLLNIVSFAQTLDTRFPVTNGQVNACVVSGNTIYIGGNFTLVGSSTRNNIAAIDASTGTVTTWNPNANGVVNALAVSGSTVYAGGAFTKMNVPTTTRNRIAAIDAVSGTVTAWDPNANYSVAALAVSGSTVYAGGNFTIMNGTTARNGIAAIDTSGTGTVTAWNPNANNQVFALAVSGSTVYAGGVFTTMNVPTTTRNRIAAIDASTGTVTTWNPNASAPVYALAVSGSTVYAGGVFTTMNVPTTTRNYIAAIDASTGTVTTWNPNANGTVYALAVSGTTVYAGGSFTIMNVPTTTRNRLAAIDASGTGTVTAWDPNASNIVYSLALDFLQSKVYVGGIFSSVFQQPAANFAALTNTADATLPVELTSFSASVKKRNVSLKWETATEVNSASFNIERARVNTSGTDSNWQKIASIKAAGNSNSPKEYRFADSLLDAGKFQYRLKMVDNDGSFEYSQTVEVSIALPKAFALSQNYPNPFNPSTKIEYELPSESPVTIEVYNLTGERVSVLQNGMQQAGYHTVNLDGTNLSSGVYFYMLRAGGFKSVKKMVMMK